MRQIKGKFFQTVKLTQWGSFIISAMVFYSIGCCVTHLYVWIFVQQCEKPEELVYCLAQFCYLSTSVRRNRSLMYNLPPGS